MTSDLATTARGDTVSDPKRLPGSLLLSPYPIGSLILVVLNDDLFKSRWPGLTTGKLSDFAGSFLLPVLVLSVGEIVLSRPGRQRLASAVAVTTVCVLTGVGLILVKTWPTASAGYGSLVGLARYPVLWSFRQVEVATDPTDLVALVSVFGAWFYCLKQASSSPG
jgi:hypothetical protein